MNGALAGIRVLDLTRYVPGPGCTRLLAALGADVVKVEEPPAGDPTRAMGPGRDGESAIHAALNGGKRSIAVNLRDPRGADVVRRLAARADVLVEAFRPGVLARRGLGAPELTAENPRLVYCSISGYGAEGPLAGRAGHDITYLARGGLLEANRDAAGTPVLPPAPLADMTGVLFATVGVLAALQARERTGRGQVVGVSLAGGALASMALPAARVAAGASLASELTGTHACYNVYRCRDGRFLAVGALEPKFWQALCGALGRPDLASRQWAAGAEQATLVRELRELFATRDREEWTQALGSVDACVEPVLDLGEALAAAGGIAAPETALQLSATPLATPGPAPAVGHHAGAVLREAGYASPEIAGLRAAGVVA